MRVLEVDAERGGRAVLHAIDLDLRAGHIVALAGPNGAGKSSLLAVLAGDLPVTSGSVMLADAPLGSWSPTETAMRRGVLLQRSGIAFPFRVEDVVRMGRAPWAGADAEVFDDALVADAMAELDIAGLADRRATELSGGEAARVGLARLLAQATDVLLLDEPTAALDLDHQEGVMEVLRRRADAGAAILIVLHDLDLAAAYADSIVLMDRGRIVAAGEAWDVLTEERLSTVYRRPIEVIAHPGTGRPLVMPRRTPARSGP